MKKYVMSFRGDNVSPTYIFQYLQFQRRLGSSLTLGVYLIHMIIVYAYDILLEKLEIEMSSIYALIRFVVVFVLSFLIAFIISKIKYINKLIKL